MIYSRTKTKYTSALSSLAIRARGRGKSYRSRVYFKKTKDAISNVNFTYINAIDISEVIVEVISWDEAEEVEADEMRSFVKNKDNQRWLWYAIDHNTRKILAFVFGEREINGKNEAFKELKKLLKPFGIKTVISNLLISTYR